jgi:maltokinase
MAQTPPAERRLHRLASTLTPEWLERQRWYRTKSRRLAEVKLADAGQLPEIPGWLLVVAATDETGALARYLVPAIADGDAFREPAGGEGVWRAIAELILAGGELAAIHGRWVCTPTRAAAELVPEGLAGASSLRERALAVEQSNTSVALGEALMLKLYRLVEPGTNPEVEMNAFLTDVGFGEAPALAGSAAYLAGGESHAAAMLQQLIPAAGDAWRWMLDRLAAAPDGPPEALGAIAEIGRLTAAMHDALRSRPDTPGFPWRAATPEERSSWRRAAEELLEAAQQALDGDARPRLAAIAGPISARLGALDGAQAMNVSRIHGDYHLGQLLRTGDGGFRVLDFEGEPARTLAERRAPASPLRDVAGMLRSLDYAAQTVASASSVRRARWLDDARAAFLEGYGGISAAEGPLLAAFELEKACYEVVYEANNRPDWVWLPLGALERLARPS